MHDEERRIAYFRKGARLHAAGQLAAAEAAFSSALELDRQLLGRQHPAVADALNSIGIVRRARGDLEGALVAFRQALAIYRDSEPETVAAALDQVAGIQLKLGDFDDARATYLEGVVAAKTAIDRIRAWHGAGESCRRMARFPEAFGTLAMATHADGTRATDALADELSRAWYAVGLVAKHGLAHCEHIAALAFWYAQLIGGSEIREKAAEMATGLPLVEGDPAAWRLVYRDAKTNVHVASLAHGMFHARTPIDAELGDVLDVLLDDDSVVRIRRVS